MPSSFNLDLGILENARKDRYRDLLSEVQNFQRRRRDRRVVERSSKINMSRLRESEVRNLKICNDWPTGRSMPIACYSSGVSMTDASALCKPFFRCMYPIITCQMFYLTLIVLTIDP
ncbi:hypothetical protein L208DRAFT_192023 [Tricholoma matsutake]|nr:hypothetical protein L208DRAFT_192023 [Tricholoma matsutake 945]